ncbi:SLAC1 family transporter [Pyruvatibacter sp.]
MPIGRKTPARKPQRPDFTQIPVQFFGATLGLTGLALAWQRAENLPIVPDVGVASVLLILAGIISVLIFTGYGLKAMRAPALVGADLMHPARVTSLGAAPMTLMLLPAGVLPSMPEWAAALSVMWLVGAFAHVALASWLVITWLRRRPALQDVTPAWFVPLVGMVVAPSAGVDLGYAPLAAAIAFAGSIAWLVMLPIVLWRLARSPALPVDLVPGVFVLVAPPALVALALGALAELSNGTAHVAGLVVAHVAAGLFYVSCAFLLPVALIILGRIRDIRALGFTYGWWSATFPLAALASAGLQTQAMLPTAIHHAMATGALALVTLVTATVGVLTLRLIIQRP